MNTWVLSILVGGPAKFGANTWVFIEFSGGPAKSMCKYLGFY